MVFSAGNSGPSGGTIGTPGNGKNMITVGASENRRPSDEGGNWTDGCNIGPTGADNAMDVISFSSRGPAPGGRPAGPAAELERHVLPCQAELDLDLAPTLAAEGKARHTKVQQLPALTLLAALQRHGARRGGGRRRRERWGDGGFADQ